METPEEPPREALAMRAKVPLSMMIGPVKVDAAVERTRPGPEVSLTSKVPAPEMTPEMVCDWPLPKAKVAPLLMAMLAA